MSEVKYTYSEAFKNAVKKYRESEHGHQKILEYSHKYHQEHKNDDEYKAKKREQSKKQHQTLMERKQNDEEYKLLVKQRAREQYLKRKQKLTAKVVVE